MIVYGYAKQYRYEKDGTLMVQVRIPNTDGPYKQEDAKGRSIKNYVKDEDLRWYPSLITPQLPCDGDVVVMESLNENSSKFIIIGVTGGRYSG